MKKALLLTYAIVALVFGGFWAVGYAWNSYKEHVARGEQEAANRVRAEQRISQAIEHLKVGPEVMHADREALKAIAEIRRQMFERHGVTEVHRYNARSTPLWNGEPFMTEEHCGKDFSRAEWIIRQSDAEKYGAATYEEQARRDAMHACEYLTSVFRGSAHRYAREHLAAHPFLYKTDIRPRLMILVDASDEDLAFVACEALVAAGERSDAICERVASMRVAQSNFYRERVVRLFAACDYPVPEPWPRLEELPAINGVVAQSRAADDSDLPLGAIRRLEPSRHGGPQLLYADETRAVVLIGASDQQATTTLHSVDLATGETSPLGVGDASARHAAVAADGKRLATFGRYAVPGKSDKYTSEVGRVKVWDIEDGSRLADLEVHNATWLQWTLPGHRLIVGTPKGLQVFSTKGTDDDWTLEYYVPLILESPLAFRCRWGHSTRVGRERFPYGGIALGRTKDNRLASWSIPDGDVLPAANPLVEVRAMALSRTASQLITFSSRQLTRWDIMPLCQSTAKRPRIEAVYDLQMRLRGRQPEIIAAAYSPNETFLVTRQLRSPDLIVWTPEGRPVGRIAGHRGPVTDMWFAGDKLITASDDSTILVWDWRALAAMCSTALEER